MNDLIAGHVPVMFAGVSAALPQIKAATLRSALAAGRIKKEISGGCEPIYESDPGRPPR